MHGNFAVHINNQLLFLKNRLFFLSSIVHFNATETLIVYERSKWILSWQEVGREKKKEMVLKQHTGQQVRADLMMKTQPWQFHTMYIMIQRLWSQDAIVNHRKVFTTLLSLLWPRNYTVYKIKTLSVCHIYPLRAAIKRNSIMMCLCVRWV